MVQISCFRSGCNKSAISILYITAVICEFKNDFPELVTFATLSKLQDNFGPHRMLWSQHFCDFSLAKYILSSTVHLSVAFTAYH